MKIYRPRRGRYTQKPSPFTPATQLHACLPSPVLIQFAPRKHLRSPTTSYRCKKIRMFAALGMYQAGELSIGAACELAGVDRYAFLDFCKREGVNVQTQTPDELEAEFKKG